MQKYSKLIIYYHTGTGNALTASRWIIDEAEKQGLTTELHSIDYNYKPTVEDITPSTLVGFLYPTHGFGASPAMLKFVLKFPNSSKSDFFLMNTRAGMKLSKIFFPGASGIAIWLLMLILFIKGFRCVGARPMDLPSNWISLHPGLNSKTVQAIHNRCEIICKKFINKLLNGKKEYYRALFDLPIDVFLTPIAVIYFLVGRFILAKTFIYTEECNDCMLCVNNCPVGAIIVKNNKPFWTHHCESCMRCIDICPKKSIQASHLAFAVAVLFAFIPFSIYIGTFFNIYEEEIPFFSFFLDSYLTLTIFYLFYIILHKFLKTTPISRLFKYTSLTTYWRRYLNPNVKIKDFKKN